MDFVAFDVETANHDFASICQVGVVVFTGGKVATRQSIFVNPNCAFDQRNVSIHGIRPSDVARAPSFADVYNRLFGILRGQVLVHYSAFDRSAVRQAAQRCGAPLPDCIWLDTSMVCRQAWDRYATGPYGLAVVAADFGITFRHHAAVEDAEAAGHILVRAISETGIPLAGWVERQREALDAATARRKSPKAAERPVANPRGPLAGNVIVFTGTLSIERAAAMVLAVEAGCEVMNSVSKRTTLLVVGEPDDRQKPGQRSDKYRKADKLIGEGVAIRIMTEGDFNALVGAA